MNAEAHSEYSKYDPYLFDPENFYRHGKDLAFEKWGHTLKDADWLQKELERQAIENIFLVNICWESWIGMDKEPVFELQFRGEIKKEVCRSLRGG